MKEKCYEFEFVCNGTVSKDKNDIKIKILDILARENHLNLRQRYSQGLTHDIKNHGAKMATLQNHCISHKCTQVVLFSQAPLHPAHWLQTSVSQIS
jgi:hypothetical protein